MVGIRAIVAKNATVQYNKSMKTDYLFARPSFVRGAASILNLRGKKIYNESSSAEEADVRAAFSDWSMIGQDIQGALNVFGR